MFRIEMWVIRLRDRFRSPVKVLVQAGVRPGMTVLDFGCGPGGFSLAAAELVGPEGRVIAVDVQRPALASVRRAVARRGIGNMSAIQGSDMPELPTGAMDMALLYDVLHCHPEPDRVRTVLTSLYRLLKPGGVLSVRDHHLQEATLLGIVTAERLFRYVGRTRWSFQFNRIEGKGVARPNDKA